MSALRKPREILTADEYLRQERLAETKSEFVNGRVYAMAGASMNHNRIALNCASALQSQLRDRPCEVFSSDVKVRIDKANVFRYPDVSGLCGPILSHDSHKDAYCNPSIIIEVLSPSTEALDRGEKFNLYRLLDSLFEYVLVRQDRIEVEVFSRDSENHWSSVMYNEPGDSLPLKAIGCTVTLAEVYGKVEFSA